MQNNSLSVIEDILYLVYQSTESKQKCFFICHAVHNVSFEILDGYPRPTAKHRYISSQGLDFSETEYLEFNVSEKRISSEWILICGFRPNYITIASLSKSYYLIYAGDNQISDERLIPLSPEARYIVLNKTP